ncbi:LysR substrate-binding domain-containing protein [Pendulispora albinea]|uniref:LysR family transcriptional regulator n=1 Tax=Pendulispora albinea TaxID=2741071 RepID=A0ABZ2M9A2_9BACT
MRSIDLNLVRAFVAVHETGSFSGAASRLGTPRSTVSRAISALETSLGATLFHRTTRHVSSSSAGSALYERIGPQLHKLESSLADVPEREEVPSGTLRITSTVDLGTMVLADAVARFNLRYPGTRVDVHLTGSLVDLVRDGFDLALRINKPSTRRDSSLVAQRVGTVVIGLYAAPGYLARRGSPRAPVDLAEHDWVAYRSGKYFGLSASGELLLSEAESNSRITPEPRVVCDDMFFMREALRAGAGIGAIPSFLGDPDVASGSLVRLIPRWVEHIGQVYVVHPGRKNLPRKVTAFRDLLVEQLRQRPLSTEVSRP